MQIQVTDGSSTGALGHWYLEYYHSDYEILHGYSSLSWNQCPTDDDGTTKNRDVYYGKQSTHSSVLGKDNDSDDVVLISLSVAGGFIALCLIAWALATYTSCGRALCSGQKSQQPVSSKDRS